MASGSSGGQRHFYGIFVSSTSMDLTAYRVAARQAIETQRQHPIMMEDFGAQNGDGSTVSTDEVARADLVLMVVAWRYGYVPAGETRSITHLEFLEAVRLDKPRLVFLAKPETEARDDLFPREQRDPEHHAQLLAFRAELGHDRAVAYFSTPDELERAVYRAVGGWLRERPASAVSASSPAPPPVSDFAGREEQVSRLRDQLLVLGIAAMLAVLVITSVLIITNTLPSFLSHFTSVQPNVPNSTTVQPHAPTFAYGKTYDYHGYPLGQTKQIAPNLKDDTYVKIMTLELHHDRANPAADRSILTLSVHNADSKQSVSLPIKALRGIYLLDSHGLRFSATDIDHQELMLLPGQDAIVKIQLTLIFDDEETDLFLYFDPTPAILQTHCVHLLPTNEANDKCLT